MEPKLQPDRQLGPISQPDRHYITAWPTDGTDITARPTTRTDITARPRDGTDRRDQHRSPTDRRERYHSPKSPKVPIKLYSYITNLYIYLPIKLFISRYSYRSNWLLNTLLLSLIRLWDVYSNTMGNQYTMFNRLYMGDLFLNPIIDFSMTKCVNMHNVYLLL